jgi:hypothetical protein
MNRLVVVAALLVLPLAARADDEPVEKPSTKLLKFVRAGDAAKLDAELAALRAAGKPKGSFEDRIKTAFEELTDNRSIEKDVARLCEKAPRSAWARTLHGELLVHLAWDARGSGFSNTVTDEGWRVFHDRLKDAKTELEKAYELDPKLPYAPMWLITVALALQLGDDACQSWFEKAVKADPGLYAAYSQRLMALMPKWGGSKARLLAFARKPLDNAPDEPALALLVIDAPRELGAQDPSYVDDPDVKKEMNAALRKIAEKYPSWGLFHHECASLAASSIPAQTGFLEKAAASGSTAAMMALFHAYEGQLTGVPRDEKKMARWLRAAAYAGDPNAQSIWGNFRLQGLMGVEKDEKDAVRWWQRSADAENADGLACLGQVYLGGIGGTTCDVPKGLSLIRQATERRSAFAMFLLYGIYRDGVKSTKGEVLVAKDEEQAKKWLERSAALKYPPAVEKLGR